MQALDSLDQVRPKDMSVQEWRLRLELAACYRLYDFLGWTEMIYNHITVRIPDSPHDNPQYLINPYGLHYAEVTARNLVKTDVQVTLSGDSEYPINPARFTIHSAIHGARHDAQCVMHTHTTAGMAVACKKDGLRYDNFYTALLYDQVAYHDFEGITTDPQECTRLVSSIGQKNILILRNHGLLVAGADVPSAFQTMWTVQRGCEIQLASDQVRGENIPISDDILKSNPQRRVMQADSRPGQLLFDGMLRRAGIRYADLA